MSERIAAALRNLAVKIEGRDMALREFIASAWGIIEPGKTMIPNWHIDYICEMLTAVSLGQIKRLLINIPPRWSKSSLVTICWPCWEWTRRPDMRYMFVSYDQGLSTDHSLARRAILESEWYRERWGDRVELASDQNQKTFIQNTVRGKMIATSWSGGATGKGGDRIVFDDFINPKMAESDAERTTALNSYAQTFSSRLDDKTSGAMVCVEQRLHVKDLSAKLIAEGGWTHVVIPTDTVAGERLTYKFPLSGRVVEVPESTPIWPEREPLDIIIQDRRVKGSRAHDAQCRQKPSSDEGAIFKRNRWRFYTTLPTHRKDAGGKLTVVDWDDLIQSWDCTFKDTDGTDYVVGQVWGRMAADRYFLDQVRDRMSLPATMAAIIMLTEKWPKAHRKLIEDKANGPAVIQMLDKKVPGLIAVNPSGGKIVRARAVEPFQESGNIYLPSPEICPWIEEFIERAAAFPAVDHDDEIDAMTQANIYFTADDTPRLTIL